MMICMPASSPKSRANSRLVSPLRRPLGPMRPVRAPLTGSFARNALTSRYAALHIVTTLFLPTSAAAEGASRARPILIRDQ